MVQNHRDVLGGLYKTTDARLDRSLRYLKLRFPDCPAWQVSATGRKDFLSPKGIRVCPALTFLSALV